MPWRAFQALKIDSSAVAAPQKVTIMLLRPINYQS